MSLSCSPAECTAKINHKCARLADAINFYREGFVGENWRKSASNALIGQARVRVLR